MKKKRREKTELNAFIDTYLLFYYSDAMQCDAMQKNKNTKQNHIVQKL